MRFFRKLSESPQRVFRGPLESSVIKELSENRKVIRESSMSHQSSESHKRVSTRVSGFHTVHSTRAINSVFKF